MQLSISNIGWTEEQDELVYNMMKNAGFGGLEIAPTRIFPNEPYGRLEEAKEWSHKLKANYGFIISSMQSIWYGRQEKVFGSEEERKELLNYTKKAIDFASIMGCKNLVFGCPRNRVVPEKMSDEQVDAIAIPFFRELGEYATEKNTILAMEANPTIYNTNYINNTLSALELIKKVDSKGFLLNLDVGTMIENSETIDELESNIKFINHVHISEPGLKKIEHRKFHNDLICLLKLEGYNGFISIEMGKQEKFNFVLETIRYIENLYCK